MAETFVNKFTEKITELGVTKGTILYVASDITRLMYMLNERYDITGKDRQNAVLNELVDALKEAVGESGTLLFPVFSWKFCGGKGFDIVHTKGEVGALNNWILKNRPDFVRTKHPMYSFMVWGKDSKYLAGLDNQDAWGEYSPFTYLKNNNALELDIDIEPYQGMTFVHYTEQCANVPYRHIKYFFGRYTDADGRSEMRMYSMNVRDMEVATGVAATDEFFIKRGVGRKDYVDDISLSLIDLSKAYPYIYDDIKNNNGKETLYFKTGGLDWSKPKTLPYEIGKIPSEE